MREVEREQVETQPVLRQAGFDGVLLIRFCVTVGCVPILGLCGPAFFFCDLSFSVAYRKYFQSSFVCDFYDESLVLTFVRVEGEGRRDEDEFPREARAVVQEVVKGGVVEQRCRRAVGELSSQVIQHHLEEKEEPLQCSAVHAW